MIILYYGLRDKRTTVIAKLPAVLAVVYLLSPIDLIPDFIPFFGYLDDLVIVPLLLNLAIRMLPRQVREESILKASGSQKKLKLLIFACILILVALLTGLFFLTRSIIRSH